MGRKQKLKAEKAKGIEPSLQESTFEASSLSDANDALSDCEKAIQKFLVGDRSALRRIWMLACSVNKVARALCNLPSYLGHWHRAAVSKVSPLFLPGSRKFIFWDDCSQTLLAGPRPKGNLEQLQGIIQPRIFLHATW